jgi:hypothetical protein
MRAARGYVVQYSSGVAQRLTSDIHRIFGLIHIDSKYIVSKMAGSAVGVGCIEGDSVQ